MEKPQFFAKAAYTFSILAFVLSFFPFATVALAFAKNVDLMYSVLMGGIFSYFPVVGLAFFCDVRSGDAAVTRLPDRSRLTAYLLTILSHVPIGTRRESVTMKSPASGWLARSGISLVVQMVLILIGMVFFLR